MIRLRAQLWEIDQAIEREGLSCEGQVDEGWVEAVVAHEIWTWVHGTDSILSGLDWPQPMSADDARELFDRAPELPPQLRALLVAAEPKRLSKEVMGKSICVVRYVIRELVSNLEGQPSVWPVVVERIREARNRRRHEEGWDIVGEICAARRAIAEADAELADERRIGRVSGFVNASRMRRAGEDKVRAQDDLRASEKAFFNRTGKRFRLTDWACNDS